MLLLLARRGVPGVHVVEVVHRESVVSGRALIGRAEEPEVHLGIAARAVLEVGVGDGSERRSFPLEQLALVADDFIEDSQVDDWTVGGQHRLGHRVQVHRVLFHQAAVGFEVLVGDKARVMEAHEALASQPLVIKPPQMSDLVEGRIQQVLEIFYLVDIVIRVDNVVPIDYVLGI